MSVIEAAKLQDFARYRHYLMIEDRRTGMMVPLDPNSIQQDIRKQIVTKDRENEPVRLIILKARRAGCSTILQGTMAHRGFTRKNFTGLTIAHDLDTAGYLFGMTERMYNALPDQIRPERRHKLRGKFLALANDSLLKVETAENRQAGRGLAVRFLHCSEVAFWPDPRSTLLALRQTVPREPGTVIALESTANGVGNYFHIEWVRAENNESNYIPLFYAWWRFREYAMPEPEMRLDVVDQEEADLRAIGVTDGQLLWRRITIKDECGGDLDLFHQEYPSTAAEAFIVSGRPFFGASVRNVHPQEPLRVGDFHGAIEKGSQIHFEDNHHGRLKIWELPERDTRYVAFCDPAGGVTLDRVETFDDRGEGEDFSCVQVVNCRTGAQCAEWHGRIDLSLLSEVCFRLGTAYNQAIVAVEMNGGYGAAVVDPLYNRLSYSNVYIRKQQHTTGDRVTRQLGWHTTSITRPQILEGLRDVVRDSPHLLRSGGLCSELSTFVYAKSGKPMGDAGCHDDRVMAMAGAYELYKEFAQVSKLEVDSRKKRGPRRFSDGAAFSRRR